MAHELFMLLETLFIMIFGSKKPSLTERLGFICQA